MDEIKKIINDINVELDFYETDKRNGNFNSCKEWLTKSLLNTRYLLDKIIKKCEELDKISS